MTDEVRRLMLTQFFLTTVDAADFDWLSQWKWYAANLNGYRYAVRDEWQLGKRQVVLMHRAIVRPAAGRIVDHVSGNTLDNRRSNLRVCTYSQNLQNARSRAGSSRFKGVSWHRQNQTWRARITVLGRAVYLGCFDDEEAAALAYDHAALRHFGAFARINFPTA